MKNLPKEFPPLPQDYEQELSAFKKREGYSETIPTEEQYIEDQLRRDMTEEQIQQLKDEIAKEDEMNENMVDGEN